MCKFQSPFPGEIRFSIITSTESRTSDEDDIGTSPHSGVHRQNWGMKVFERMVTSRTTTGPLTNDRESGIRTSNRYDLTDCFCRTRFQRDIFDPQTLKASNTILAGLYLGVQIIGDFERWDACTDGDSFNSDTSCAKTLDEIHLPIKETRIDINRVDTDSRAGIGFCDDFPDGCFHHVRSKVSSTSKFNLISCIHRSDDE